MTKKSVEDEPNQLGNSVLNEILLELRKLNSILTIANVCDAERISSYVESVIGSSKRRADVYLQTDGKKTATEIAQILGMKRPNVSIEHKVLLDAGLIQVNIKVGKGYVYRKSSILEIIAFAGLLLSPQQQQGEDENPIESSGSEVEEMLDEEEES